MTDHIDNNRVSVQDIIEQDAICARILERTGGGICHIITYGCQMNAHDAEALTASLDKMGYGEGALEDADIIVFVTCCVRDNAERRLLGNVQKLRERATSKGKRPIIAICGCMTQQDGVAERMAQKLPFIKLVFGTGLVHRFPEMILACMDADEPLVFVDGKETLTPALDAKRANRALAYVNVMYGCDNYCSYCIVPYVRGHQRSRAAEDIVAEAEALAADGVREITLLGQNVNSYGLDSGGISFPELLRRLDGIVPRIRFMTSHPKDLSPALIEAVASLGSVCPQLHLPVQSGSDRILGLMNRRYDIETYLSKLDALRVAVPHIGVTSDLIVAFPGESDEDFEHTLELVRRARFDAAFTFIYSPRNGTRAAQMEGRVPKAVSLERIERLIALQESVTAQVLGDMVGSVQPVLFEKEGRRHAGQVAGRIPRGQTVNVHGEASLIGGIHTVRITGAGHNTLTGTLVV